MGSVVKEVTLGELTEMLQSHEGEFIFHVELGKGEDDEDAGKEPA